MKNGKRGKIGKGKVEGRAKVLIFVVLCTALACVSIGYVSGATIYVPDSYAKIRWAGDNVSAGDTITRYSYISVNTTVAGKPALFAAHWTDNVALSGYIFATNNSSSEWVNDSFVSMTGTANWSNVTKTLNSTAGIAIGWRIYANDTSGNWNDTGVQTLTTRLPGLTPKPDRVKAGEFVTIEGTGFGANESVTLSSCISDIAINVSNGKYNYSLRDFNVSDSNTGLSVSVREVEDNMTITLRTSSFSHRINNDSTVKLGLEFEYNETTRTAEVTSGKSTPAGVYEIIEVSGVAYSNDTAVNMTITVTNNVTTDANGSFKMVINTHGMPEGEHEITADGAEATLTITTPTLTVTPAIVSVGKLATIEGTGFGADESVTLSSSISDIAINVSNGKYNYSLRDFNVSDSNIGLSFSVREVEDDMAITIKTDSSSYTINNRNAITLGSKLGFVFDYNEITRTSEMTWSSLPVGEYELIEVSGTAYGNATAVIMNIAVTNNVTTDANGSFKTVIDTHGIPDGKYKITADDAEATLTITTPILMVTPDTVLSGDFVTIEGTGFEPGEPVTLSCCVSDLLINVSDGKYNYWSKNFNVSDSNTSFSFSVREVEDDMTITIMMASSTYTIHNRSAYKLGFVFDYNEATKTAKVTSGTFISVGVYEVIEVSGTAYGNATAVIMNNTVTNRVMTNTTGGFKTVIDTHGIPTGEYRITADGAEAALTIITAIITPPTITNLHAVPNTGVNVTTPTIVSATVTDDVKLSGVGFFVINNQTKKYVYGENLTGKGVNDTYSAVWDATEFEMKNATSYSGTPVSAIKDYIPGMYVVSGNITLNATSEQEFAIALFDMNGTLFTIVSKEWKNYSVEPGNTTFTPFAVTEEKEMIDLTTLTLTGAPEDHFNVSLMNNKSVPKGEYMVGMYAVDTAGYEAINKTPVTVGIADTEAPVINSVVLSTYETTAKQPITVTVNVTDIVGVTSVTAEGVALTQKAERDTWIGVITAVEGTNVIVNVTAKDAAGNVAYNNTTTYNATAIAPTPTPSPTPTVIYKGGGGGGGSGPDDTDGDGYSDMQEMIIGSNPEDPCDPDPNCVACLALSGKPAPVVTPAATSRPRATVEYLPTPTPAPSATPTSTPLSPSLGPGKPLILTVVLLAVIVLVVVIFFLLRKYKTVEREDREKERIMWR
ncbi:MAG: hypothetical protein WAV32_02885 [Halobacteriota archaeon]